MTLDLIQEMMLSERWHEFLEFAAIVSLVCVAPKVFLPLGGIAVALFSLPQAIPYLGRIYRFIVHGPFKLLYPVKLASWVLSGSGTLAAFLALRHFMDKPWTDGHYLALLAALSATALSSVSRVLEFDLVPRTSDLLNGLAQLDLFRRMTQNLDDDDRDRLARANFMNMLVAQLFGFLTTAGLIFFALAKLSVIAVAPEQQLSVKSAMLEAWSMGNIFGTGYLFSGDSWVVTRALFQFTLFLWLNLFLQLGPSLLDRDLDRDKATPLNNTNITEDDIRRLVERVIAEGNESSSKNAKGSRRSSRARRSRGALRSHAKSTMASGLRTPNGGRVMPRGTVPP